MRTIWMLVICLAATCLMAGCATSRVQFEQPAGAKLRLMNWRDKKVKAEYELPATVELYQKDKPWSDKHGRAIRMELPDGTLLRGYLFVYKVDLDKIDRLTPVTFRLTDEKISQLREGRTVSVEGFSSWGWPVYKVVLALERRLQPAEAQMPPAQTEAQPAERTPTQAPAEGQNSRQ